MQEESHRTGEPFHISHFVTTNGGSASWHIACCTGCATGEIRTYATRIVLLIC